MIGRIQRKGSPTVLFITFLMITSPTVCLSADDMWSSVFEYQNKMANYGNPEAQVKLGEMYEEGHGTEQDYDKARTWYQKAADQGFAPAKKKLSKLKVRQKKAAEARIRQEELERVRAEREKLEAAESARRSQTEQRRQARTESRTKNQVSNHSGKNKKPVLSEAEKAKQEAEARKRAKEAIKKMLSVPSAYSEE